MHLEWISLVAFRSHDSLEWRPDPGVNVLVGDNGVGKTNLLEAVSYLAALRSFRGAPDEALVAHGADAAVIRGSVAHRDTESLIEIEIRRRGPRRAQVNRQRLQRTSDLLGHARIVSFLPEDLDVVKRGPALRRDLLDDAAVQLWPASAADQSEFDRALRQRNAFLKQGAHDEVTLSVWDERLAQAAGRVLVRRSRTADALADQLSSAYADVSREETEVSIDYRSSTGSGLDSGRTAQTWSEEVLTALRGRHRFDRERRVTTVGPHRDEPTFLLGGHDARHHASQGEQRTLALAVRLATHRAITAVTDSTAVLLLDDVYSELDPGRAAALTSALPVAQTLITTADPGHVPVEGSRWDLVPGEVRAA